MIDRGLSASMAAAANLSPENHETVMELVEVWRRHYYRNRLRDKYYAGDVKVKDLGISVLPEISRKLDPRIDWAAKCVNWWADRVQFEGFNSTDDPTKDELYTIAHQNDMDNLVRKVTMSSLRHSVSFVSVTAGNTELGEPDVVVSGYPATASSALWSDALKRITAALVVVDVEYNRSHNIKTPKLVYVFTDTQFIILTLVDGRWVADETEHAMGRVPVEQVAYHGTLEHPFGTSRITPTVMSLVDDAQREIMNMSATAAFASAPQKFLMGADKEQAKKIAETPFGAFIGSTFVGTPNKNKQIPNYGQLPQLTMQPHSDYMRLLASMFSDATSVPLSSLSFTTANPTSADAIIASQEDAIIDINSYILACKRAFTNVAIMALSVAHNLNFFEALKTYDITTLFAKPETPSPVSMSDAVTKRIAAFPWMAQSDVPLRDLGYKDDELRELQADRKRSGAQDLVKAAAQSE